MTLNKNMTLNQIYAKSNNYQLVQKNYNKELFGYWKCFVVIVNGLLYEYHLALLVNGDKTEDLLISIQESELVQKFDILLSEERISLEQFESLAISLLKVNIPLIVKNIF